MKRLMILFALFGALAGVACAAQEGADRPEGIPKDWVQYKAREAFNFWGPADLVEEKVAGIDSYVGRWKSKTMTVSFDYGLYSGKYSGEKYKTESVDIDGRKGTLATWDQGVGLYVERNAGIKLSIGIGCDKSLHANATQMLKSLKFSKSEQRDGN